MAKEGALQAKCTSAEYWREKIPYFVDIQRIFPHIVALFIGLHGKPSYLDNVEFAVNEFVVNKFVDQPSRLVF